MKFLIYGLRDPRTGDVRYVGKSCNGMKRPKNHAMPCFLRGDTHKERWVRELKTLGLMYEIDVLESFDSNDALSDAECFWISQARALGWPLTNIAKGGEGATGFKRKPFTESHRAKLRAAQQNRSPEHRAKLGMAARGRPKTADEIAKLRRGNLGKKMSPEAIERTRLANTGLKRSSETRARMSDAKKLMYPPGSKFGINAMGAR